MPLVVTQTEMQNYRGSAKAYFPVGTIITPSAKDWAMEQGIEVVFTDENGNTSSTTKPLVTNSQGNILDEIIKSVINAFKSQNIQLDKDNIVKAVEVTLKTLSNTK